MLLPVTPMFRLGKTSESMAQNCALRRSHNRRPAWHHPLRATAKGRSMFTARHHWNDLKWRDDATCRDLDPEIFFPIGVTGAAVEQIEAAKQFCRACTSQQACLEFAITTNQEYGVWGATTEDERRVLRRQWRAEVRRQRVAS